MKDKNKEKNDVGNIVTPVEVKAEKVVVRKTPERFVMPVLILVILIAMLIISMVNISGALRQANIRHEQHQEALLQNYNKTIMRIDEAKAQNELQYCADRELQIIVDKRLADELEAMRMTS